LGGWRIIRTMGKGLTEIESPQGFAAESSSTAVLLASSHLGFPLSTTQVCSGSILGAGLGKRLAEVRWTVAGRMALAWLFTLPAAAMFAFGVTAMSRRAVAIDEKKPPAFVDTAVATLCLAACLAAVLYGLYLIIPQFH